MSAGSPLTLARKSFFMPTDIVNVDFTIGTLRQRKNLMELFKSWEGSAGFKAYTPLAQHHFVPPNFSAPSSCLMCARGCIRTEFGSAPA